MPTAKGNKLKSSKKKGIGLLKGGLLAFVVWAGLTLAFIGLVVLTDGTEVLYSSDFPFIMGVYMGIFALSVLYAFGVLAIYSNAQRHGRNAVRWMTAAIVFSPVLAWIAYGLTWRKSQ